MPLINLIQKKFYKRLRGFIPVSWKRSLLRLYLRHLFKRRTLPAPGTIRLYLAGVLDPRKKVVYGGKVKLLPLRERFGDDPSSFNIIYLVSSTLPAFADIWLAEARTAGIPVVWNQNGVGFPGWAGPDYVRFNSQLLPIHQADHVVYQSEFCKLSADRYLEPVKCPSAIINNPVDLAHFSPAPSPLPTAPLTLLVIGNHSQPERVLIPLEALKLLVAKGLEARLIIAGRFFWPDGDRDVQGKLDEYSLRDLVDFIGAYTQDEAPAIYRRAHIMLHLKYKDPCPTTVIEALASGLPVIGSNSGGLPEMVPPPAGILINVADSWDELFYPTPAELVTAILETRQNHATMAQAARCTAKERYDKEKWLSEHESIFRDLTQNSELKAQNC